MKIKSRMACPVKRLDGSWDVVTKEFEEDIPDKGRHSMICNKCSRDDCLQCRETCPIEKIIFPKFHAHESMIPRIRK